MNKYFGKNSKGEDVYIYTLKNENGMQVSFIDLGAAVYELFVPDKNGQMVQVSAVYDNPISYEKETHFDRGVLSCDCCRLLLAVWLRNGKNGAGRGKDRSRA